jgi:PAS domain-containing protein
MNDIQEAISQLKQFRQELHGVFDHRPDAVMELLDALSSTPNARSVVELSLSHFFRRQYRSTFDAIANFFQASKPERAAKERQSREQALTRLTTRYLPPPTRRDFWLLALDGVPVPRLYAPTLEDRGYVYQPRPVPGLKPITIGHQYSVLAFLPEKMEDDDPPWAVPLSTRRVPTASKATAVGAAQVAALLGDEALPFHEALCVLVADSAHSVAPFLGTVAQYENLITVTRLRGNRVLYRQPLPLEGKPEPGHPRWYGERFAFKDPTTWGQPDEVVTSTFTTRKGRALHLRLEAWPDLLMRGKKDVPMYQHPFTVIRVLVLDEQGQPVYRRPMWLAVFGKRRDKLTSLQAKEVYDQRFDEEHHFRFGKQRLLMAAYQTPDVEHEENWLQIVALAGVQLWLAREVAQGMPRPWERYLPTSSSPVASPSTVQRDFGRILQEIGTPAQPPKPRGYSPGCPKGTRLEPRGRHQVVKKPKKRRKKAPKAA